MIEKIALAFTYSYLTSEEFHWVLISIITILSVIAFIKFFVESPYHNERLTVVINIETAIFAWANIVLLISKVLEFTSFNGGLQLFLLGIPLSIALLIFNKDDRVD